MHVHANPILWEVRVFNSDPDPDGTTDFDKFEAANMVAVCLVRRIATRGEMFVSMMMGKFGHKEMNAVLEEAKRWGATKLWYERHGKLRSLTVR